MHWASRRTPRCGFGSPCRTRGVERLDPDATGEPLRLPRPGALVQGKRLRLLDPTRWPHMLPRSLPVPEVRSRHLRERP